MVTVSVILPTFNRARYLPDAIHSIRSQTFTDWELIIVNDGSTDETRSVVSVLISEIPQPVHYVEQTNLGVAAARNRGLEYASGQYIAYLDSDDLWHRSFLENSVRALEVHPEVDWVSCDAQRVDALTNSVLQSSHYVVNQNPHQFLSLHYRAYQDLYVIEDSQLLDMAISQDIVCLIQASLIRKSIFDRFRFWEECRVFEDRFFALRCIHGGVRFAYRKSCDVTLRTHENHTSLAGESFGMAEARIEKVSQIYQSGALAWLRFAQIADLTRRHRWKIRRRVAKELFWNLGYSTYWMGGDRTAALTQFERALALNPTHLKYWKTYLACYIRVLTGI